MPSAPAHSIQPSPESSERGTVLHNGYELPAPIVVDCRGYADTYLTESDRGRTIRIKETGRFGFCLDQDRHPFEELDTSDCDFFGEVSNWSLDGPLNYPVGYQVTGAGDCKVRDRDFWVRVVGTRLES